MRFILKLILMVAFGFIFSIFMPWWSLLFIAGIISFALPSNNFNAFLSGFLSIGLLWLIMAWKIDVETESVLSSKIVQLFDKSHTNVLVILSGIVGAFTGGLGAFSGNSFRQLFLKKKEQSFYS